MKGLNFKDWEKISSDPMSTTLRHAKGHVMTIAHKALPKIQQEQLKRLKMADGGDVSTSDDSSADQKSTPPDSSASSQTNAPPGTSIVINNPGTSAAPAPQAAPPAAPAIPQYTGQGPYQGAAPVSTPEVPGGDKSGIGGALQLEQKAVAQGEGIAAQKAQAQANYEDSYLKQTQALANRDQQDIQHLGGLTQTLDQYVQKNPINPRAYFENMSVPSKITGTLGLILGGFSRANGNTGPNPAMDYLLKQQDKDIEAQKSRMDQSRTVVGAYQKLFDDQIVASNLARVNYNNMLIHQANLMNAKIGTPESNQATNMLSAQLTKKNYKELGETSQRIRAIKAGQVQALPFSKASDSSESPQNMNLNQEKNAAAARQSGNPDEIDPNDINLLTPNSEAIYKNLNVKFPLMAPGDKARAGEQYNAVKQAEPVLRSIPELFHEAEKNITPGGALQRSVEPHIAGAAGEMLGPIAGAITSIPGKLLTGALTGGAAIGHALGTNKSDEPSDWQKDEKYKGLSNRIAQDFMKAIPANVLSPGLVKEIVDNNMPGRGDDPELRNFRLNNMIKELRQSIPTGAAEAAGLVKKRTK